MYLGCVGRSGGMCVFVWGCVYAGCVDVVGVYVYVCGRACIRGVWMYMGVYVYV
jgi:hypothetical protein